MDAWGDSLLAGLLLGALLGVNTVEASLVIFSTAAVNPPIRQAFYSLDVGATQIWLTASYPDEADTLLKAVTDVTSLADVENLAEAILEAEASVELLTERAFQALTGVTPLEASAPPPMTEPVPLITSLKDGPVKTCLGLDWNPYNPSGSILYLSVEVPETQTSAFPDTWEAYRLDMPKDHGMFWLALACQDSEGRVIDRSR